MFVRALTLAPCLACCFHGPLRPSQFISPVNKWFAALCEGTSARRKHLNVRRHREGEHPEQ